MTKHDATNNVNENEDTKSLKRQSYTVPRLVELGKVSDLTQSDGDNMGSDSSYS